jgi:hypothetical protein
MPFITFIYRIENNNKTFYGKFVSDYISDDHEGLDLEVKPTVIYGINEYRKHKNLEELKENVHLGVLSFSTNRYIPTYSSNEEIQCFDFYCDNDNNIYVNGQKV